MRNSVGTYPAPDQRRNGHSRNNPFRHEDAMELCLGRDAKAIGKALGLSGRTVRQWRERYDTAHRGPGQTLSITVRRSLDLGRPIHDALAPVHALAEEFDYHLVPRVVVDEPLELDEANLGLSRLLQHGCDYVSEVTESVRDGRVDSLERVRMKQKARVLRTYLDVLDQSLELHTTWPEAGEA